MKKISVETSSKEKPKAVEGPKQEYIHVRARRGQATDSHSLAERVHYSARWPRVEEDGTIISK
ncbi:putative basic helix-loop-helix leucine zipper transcription factor [Helianthus annuus]|nr:putative basic helix-loop-helix leucine zipper transcription factor [Helianthus annuus]